VFVKKRFSGYSGQENLWKLIGWVDAKQLIRLVEPGNQQIEIECFYSKKNGLIKFGLRSSLWKDSGWINVVEDRTQT
jgi:hypothetical protein